MSCRNNSCKHHFANEKRLWNHCSETCTLFNNLEYYKSNTYDKIKSLEQRLEKLEMLTETLLQEYVSKEKEKLDQINKTLMTWDLFLKDKENPSSISRLTNKLHKV